MTKKQPVTYREWALFGLRWVLPLGLLLFAVLKPAGGAAVPVNGLILVLIVAIVSNLAMALLLLTGTWIDLAAYVGMVIDVGLALTATYIGGAGMAWTGLIPVITAGFFLNWLPSTVVGAAVAIGLVVVQIVHVQDGRALNLPVLILSLIVIPAAGPLIVYLRWDEGQVTEVMEKGRRAQSLARIASEYMTVIQDISSVMTTSRNNPRRVLAAAVEYGLEGLERLGVRPPLYGGMLIFATSEEEVEPFLQMAYISSTVSPKVRDAIIPGQGGTVGTAIQISEPLLNTSPASDPELSMIETFKDCKAVLCLPLKAGDEAYGALLVGSDERDAFKDTHIEMMTILAKLSTAALDNARLYESLLIQRDRMVGIEKSARAQLASDLHDGPTQGIAAIAMRLNYIRKLIEKKPESAMSDLYQIEDMARRTSKEIRAMLFELRPKSLDEGLQAGLQALADKTKETYEQNVEIQVAKGIDEMLDDQSVQTFFSVAVEAINNARKHANASLITLRIYVQDDTLVYEIKDNGQGFDVDKALAESKKKEGHLGLFNLVERTAVVDGTLNIDSTPGEGTRITILVPVAVARQRKQDELLRRSSAAEAAAVGV